MVSRRAATMAVLIMGAVCARPAAGQTFNYLDTPVDLGASLGFGAWEDVDVSANVPAGATGVILRTGRTPAMLEWFFASGPSDYKYGARKKGSTDTWMSDSVEGSYGQHLVLIGVDANRVFEFYRQSATIELHLLGYTMAGAKFFTDSIDKSLTVAGSWQDIDISADTGTDTAIGAIVAIETFEHELFGVRPKGSTDDLYYQTFDYDACTVAVVGVDENEVFQMKIETTNTDAHLVGYVTRGAVFFTNMPDVSQTFMTVYFDVDIASHTGSDLVTGAIFQHVDTITYASGNRGYGSNVAYRGDGDAWDYYKPLRHGWLMTPTDPPNYGTVYESKVQDLDEDVYLAGYTYFDPTNYRSIGTDSSVLYSTGNVSITAGTRTMTFAGGASLPADVGRGDKVTVSGDTFYIHTKDSDTQVTVHTEAPTTRTNNAYTIMRAYNTFQAWETARQGNLVADGRREVGVAYNDGPFPAGATIDGSLCDQYYYMKVTAAEGARHDGTAGSGVVVDRNGASVGGVFNVREDYTVVEWLEITDYTGASGDGVRLNGPNALAQNLIIHDFTGGRSGIYVTDDATVRNTIIYNGAEQGIFSYGAGTAATIENVSVYNCQVAGVETDSGNVTIRNTIAAGSPTDFDLVATIDYFGYNMYSTTANFNPASYQGNNQAPPADLEDLFVSIQPALEDLHLESGGHDALDNGLSLAGVFTMDIDGEPRSVPWDLGADQNLFTTNYRSIGTDAGTLYSAGNASITAGDITVTCAGGASLPAEVGMGDVLTIGGDTFYIRSKASSTEVMVHSPAAATHTNAAYTITRAYNSLPAWEAGRGGDLVAEQRREVGVCYDDGPFTSKVTIAGSTTDSTYYLHLTVADGQGHDGTAGTGVRINDAVATVQIGDDYTRVDGLELTGKGAIVDNGAQGVVIGGLLVHDTGVGYGIKINDGSATVRNCIVYDVEDGGVWVANGSTATVENCTVYGVRVAGGTGIRLEAGTMTASNCISMDSQSADYSAGITQSYNMSSDATASGTGSLTGRDPAEEFLSISPGSEDLHLAEDADAIDAGTVGSLALDIDGDVRPKGGAWDLGADEMALTVNYRSVGTYAGTLYSTGTATVAAGSKTVTFSSADLPGTIGLGDELVIGAETMHIMSRDSATQVTVQQPAAGSHTIEAYTISRAYGTLQAWEDDRGADLVADDRREIGVCYNDGPFTVGAVISGSTTDASCFMMLTVAEGQRHTGVAGTGARIDAGGSSTDVIAIEDEYTVVEWLEIENFNGASTEGIWVDDSPPGDNALLRNLLVHGFPAGNGINAGAGVSATIRNTIVYDGWQGLKTDGGALTIENVTVYGMATNGVDANGASTVSIRNAIVVGSGSPDFNLEGAITYFGYNMYETWASFNPASYQGNNQAPPADLYDLFFSIASDSENLHLEDFGHSAVNTGIDLSSSFSTDIDGEPRSGSWDMGADQINPAPLSISSGADQLFAVADDPTEISAITITDSWLAPRITAANDIRIKIPATIDMTWDTFDTIAVLGGPAAGKVSNVVSYEDGNKTLVLDVTSDFVADDSVSITELAFANFTAESGPDNLELETDGDPSAEAQDDKTIEIGPEGTSGMATVELVWWREVEPVAAGGSSPLQSPTFDRMTTNTSSDSRSAAVFSHTIGSSCATDGVLIVICATRGDLGISSVDYDGNALTEEVSERAGATSGDEWVSIWYLVDPPLGTSTVTVTFAGSGSPSMVAAASYFGVDQSDPIGAVASASVTADSSIVTVDIDTTVADSVVVGGLAHHGGDTDPHDESGDVTAELYDIASGTATSTDSSYAGGEIVSTTTGTYTFAWTSAVADDWAIACVELKPAP